MTTPRVEKPGISLSDAAAISLPADLLKRARNRLSVAAYIYAAGYTLAFVPSILVSRDVHRHPGVEAISMGVIVAALLFAMTIRRLPVTATQAMNIGLLFEVFGAFGIEFSIPWAAAHMPVVVSGISWTCVWVVVFPVIVPVTPWRAAIAALAAASTRLVMLLITAALGIAVGDLAFHVDFLLPNYVSAGVAIAVAHIVYGWGREVAQARQLGSYRLVEQLGEGGMGEVWQAEHRMLARPAAIKLIRADTIGRLSGGQDLVRKRFEREALATAALTSPHTVQLYDFGVTADGTFYYVMELLRGLDLNGFVERFGPMPPHRVAFVLRQVCASLAEAHARGLVHRDIKPANVYLCRAGLTHDFAKVLDFGLVRQTGPSAHDVKLTAQNVAAGTPAYMAPELALGDEEIDGRADLYAVGCLAYWLLTGTQVFPSPSAARVMMAHVRDTPERPSTRTELPIPPALEELLLRCLAKQPGDRPQSAEELASALEAAVAPARWTAEDARRWWGTHLPDLAG